MQVFSNTFCLLGEGPLWHPERCELFWIDILSKKLFSKGETERFWAFDGMLSASGWVYDTLLIASETALWRCDILTGRQDLVVSLESNNEKTRSNDGRRFLMVQRLFFIFDGARFPLPKSKCMLASCVLITWQLKFLVKLKVLFKN